LAAVLRHMSNCFRNTHKE